MNDCDTNDPSGVHWSDSMDEGLLTLEAEWFLMTLPKQLIPRMTCLIAPDLLNQLVGQWAAEHSRTRMDIPVHLRAGETVNEVLNETANEENRFTLPTGLNLQHLANYETAIRVELVNLCKWLNLTQNMLYDENQRLKAA